MSFIKNITYSAIHQEDFINHVLDLEVFINHYLIRNITHPILETEDFINHVLDQEGPENCPDLAKQSVAKPGLGCH